MEYVMKFWMVLMFTFLLLFVLVAALETQDSPAVTCEQTVVCPEGCQPVTQSQSSSETSADVFFQAFFAVALAILFGIAFMTAMEM